jgi:ribosomal protein S18 acetylase RimI-like enzyme
MCNDTIHDRSGTEDHHHHVTAVPAMPYTVGPIRPEDTWSLRHRVLRPHQTLADCDYPGDRDPANFHLGVLDTTRAPNTVVCIGTFHAELNHELPGTHHYRLRGMATEPELRGQGLGALLLRDAFTRLKQRGADHLWCHAREGAIAFYTKLGFMSHGELFDVPGIGRHLVMSLAL